MCVDLFICLFIYLFVCLFVYIFTTQQDTDTPSHSDNYSDTMSCTSLIGEIPLPCLTNYRRQISFSCPNLLFSNHLPSNHLMKGVKTDKIENGIGRATLLKQRAIKALALNQQTVSCCCCCCCCCCCYLNSCLFTCLDD